MDDKTRNELGVERRIAASETIKLTRATVPGLCAAIVEAFSGPNKPTRILYTRGDDLVIERVVPESSITEDSPFITAFQMIRQHAEVQIIETEASPVEQVCRAMSMLSEKDFDPTMFVVSSRASLNEWFSFGKIENVFRTPVVEDPECKEDFLILCGSQSGQMLSQIEFAVFCRMEKPS